MEEQEELAVWVLPEVSVVPPLELVLQVMQVDLLVKTLVLFKTPMRQETHQQREVPEDLTEEEEREETVVSVPVVRAVLRERR